MKKGKIAMFGDKAKKLLGYGIWVLAVVFMVSTAKNINRVLRINREVEDEKEKIEKMQAENAELAAKIAETQGSEFIEKQIRDRLGFAKPEETVVIMPDEDVVRKLAPPKATLQDTLPDPNWKKWTHLFF